MKKAILFLCTLPVHGADPSLDSKVQVRKEDINRKQAIRKIFPEGLSSYESLVATQKDLFHTFPDFSLNELETIRTEFKEKWLAYNGNDWFNFSAPCALQALVDGVTNFSRYTAMLKVGLINSKELTSEPTQSHQSTMKEFELLKKCFLKKYEDLCTDIEKAPFAIVAKEQAQKVEKDYLIYSEFLTIALACLCPEGYDLRISYLKKGITGKDHTYGGKDELLAQYLENNKFKYYPPSLEWD